MSEKIVGYQSWRNLLFAHWRIEPQELQALLPAGLTIETFDGSAWLAVVPFSMEQIRPWWSPPVPGISWFLETNVRTYVRHANGQSGVWFFSLEANHRLAVAVARTFWHLNYQFAKMTFAQKSDHFTYSGRRPGDDEIEYEIAAEIDTSVPEEIADERSLEYFLLERYHLFAQRPDGRFLCGQVHHEPYQYLPVQSCQISQTLTAALQNPIRTACDPDHLVYSNGVDVCVSPLQAIG